MVVVLLLFMNGITVKETRREEDKRFFRMITGEEKEQDMEEETIGEPETDEDETSVLKDKE